MREPLEAVRIGCDYVSGPKAERLLDTLVVTDEEKLKRSGFNTCFF
ncbi:MAG: hypothetical protein ABIH46_09545 [Chloroflexota bacterium]